MPLSLSLSVSLSLGLSPPVSAPSPPPNSQGSLPVLSPSLTLCHTSQKATHPAPIPSRPGPEEAQELWGTQEPRNQGEPALQTLLKLAPRSLSARLAGPGWGWRWGRATARPHPELPACMGQGGRRLGCREESGVTGGGQDAGREGTRVKAPFLSSRGGGKCLCVRGCRRGCVRGVTCLPPSSAAG